MSIANKLEQLRRIYKQAEEQIDGLKEKTCLSCAQGCGECCRRFEPYISILEAIPIADYLLQNPEKREKFRRRAAANKENWTACPFYDPDSDLHCTIYPIRPIICRLFGFSANRATGKKLFSPCKVIQEQMPQKVKVAQRLTDAGLPIPVYQDVYQEVRSIDFHLATDFHPFSRSIEIALANREKIENGQYTSPAEADTPFKKYGDVFAAVLRGKTQGFPV